MIIEVPISVLRREKQKGEKEYNPDTGEFETPEKYVIKEEKSVLYPVQVDNIKSFHTYFTGGEEDKELKEVTMLCLKDGETSISNVGIKEFRKIMYNELNKFRETTMTKTEKDWLTYLDSKKEDNIQV